MAKKFASIIEPLEVRKKELEVKKEVFQFMRDVEDENIWMEEKMNLVTSEELGSSLQDVNMLIKKNKTLKGEIENHEHRIMSVCNVGQKLIDESHPESSEFTRQINDLMEKLEHLKHNLEARNVKLLRFVYIFSVVVCLLFSCFVTFSVPKWVRKFKKVQCKNS